MPELPTGTVTFLFTDIEGSTRLLLALGDRYADLLEDHRRVVREVVIEAGGRQFGTEGDAFFLVFASAPAAVRAAVELQRRIARSSVAMAGETPGLRVRMGLHSGEGVLRDGDYVGLDVHRVARIAAAGHGGQILISEATRGLVEGRLPSSATVSDLGEHRLKDLERAEHIYQVAVEGLPASFPPLRTETARIGNLPPQLTSFIGRERELEAATRQLDESRLLTLSGPGGTGKTRLAIQLAAGAAERFPGGAWFVALASLTDPLLVPAAIAEALGLAEVRGESRPPLERVIERLRTQPALLVLDNFEQLLPAAEVVNDLLRSVPGLTVVVTSRAVLRVYGEREFPVPPLSLPDPSHLPDVASLSQYEAVALFIQRARAVKPDFGVTNDNAPAVAEICARLDGLPLAIELAAARIRLLAPDAILSRLSDRLALLGGGARDLPDRQRTLRQAIDWSYQLLTPAEQKLFSRLAVFMGGWALEEVEVVCGPADELGVEVLDGLESLAEKSLVGTNDVPDVGTRFTMLETIREFAVEQLEGSGEADEIRRRHAEAFLELLEEAEPQYTGRTGRQWLARLEWDHDNLRAALEWAIERGETAMALRMAGSQWRFWQMRGHLHEGRMWVERCLAIPGAANHPREHAKALLAAGGIAYWQSDHPGQAAFYEQALDVSERIGDPGLIAEALYNAAFIRISQEDLERGGSMLRRSLSLFEQLQDAAGITKVRWALGDAAAVAEKWDEADAHLEASLAGARDLGDAFHTGWSLFLLGFVDIGRQRYEAAAVRMREALEVFVDTSDLTGILFQLDGLALVAMLDGRHERGVRLGAAAAALQASTGADLVGFQRPAPTPEPDLPDEEIARIRAEGEAMSLDGAIAYALEPERSPSS